MKICFLGIAIPTLLAALPQSPHVAIGTAEFRAEGHELAIHAGNEAWIDWESFSIGPEELVRFIQPDAQSMVLNRVLGAEASELLGNLFSNGQIWLINPHGILVGPDSRIDTGAFLASALDWVEGDPFSGKEILFTDGGALRVLGQIRAEGDVVLLGSELDLKGVVEAGGRLAAGSGSKVLLSAEKGIFVLAGAEGLLASGHLKGHEIGLKAYSGAICLDGIAEATELKQEGGRIFLEGKGEVTVKGGLNAPNGDVRVLGKHVALLEPASIDVSGEAAGTVLIGGDYQGLNRDVPNAEAVFVGANTSIRADGKNYGSGGKVILWSNDATRFFGSISAKGGELGGDGGFIEVSGGYLGYWGAAETLSPRGKGGELLLDPTNIVIQTLGVDMNITAAPDFSPTGAPSQVTPATIITALMMNPLVTVASSGTIDTPPDTGSITVVDPIVYSLTSDLRLTTQVSGVTAGDIIVNAPITNLAIVSGSIELLSQNNLLINQSVFTGSGNLILEAASGSLTITASGGAATDVGSTTGNVFVQNVGQNMSLLGGAGAGEAVALRTVTSGNISIDVAGDLSLIAGSGNESAANIRPLIVGNTTVQVGGSLLLQADGVATIPLPAAAIRSGPSGGNLAVTVGGNATVDSGLLNAVIMGFEAGNPGSTGTLSIGGNFTLNSNSNGATTINVLSQGAMNLFVGGNLAINSAGGTAEVFSFTSDTNVSVGGNLTADTAVLSGIASIAGNLSVQAGGSIYLSQLSTLQQFGFGSGTVTVIAGVDINLQGSSSIENNSSGGALNLVVDNLFPTPPKFGTGALIIGPSASVSTNGGALRLFTSQFGANSIQGLLNGQTFVPGGFLEDTANDQWGVYYFNPFFGNQFYTIFYKLGRFEFLLLDQPAIVAASELYRRLHPYSEYVRWGEKFTVNDDLFFLRRRSENNGESSFSLQTERTDRPDPL